MSLPRLSDREARLWLGSVDFNLDLSHRSKSKVRPADNAKECGNLCTDSQRGSATEERSEALTIASKADEGTRGMNLVAPNDLKLPRFERICGIRMG